MKKWKPKVGDKVELSREGYRSLHLDSPEAIRDATNLTITYVENVGTASDPIWVVEVDSPHVNRFMLESKMFKLKG